MVLPLRQLADHGRYRYRPITERPSYRWPDGNGLAIYIGFNLECFEFGRGHGAQLAPGGGDPDVLNYAWRDWGNRVGAWRCRELFDALEVPIAVLLNTSLYDECPQLAAAFRPDAWRWGAEFVAHGHTNAERQADMDRAREAELIARCTEAIRAAEGAAPQGWLSPWISESADTPDLLARAGYRYTLNWCHDDQPLPMRVDGGRLWSVPYPQEVNDIPAIVQRKMGGAEFAQLIEDAYDELVAASARTPLVMGIALHPYLVGQPARLRHLRRVLMRLRDERRAWWCTPAQIVAHVESLPDVAGLEP